MAVELAVGEAVGLAVGLAVGFHGATLRGGRLQGYGLREMETVFLLCVNALDVATALPGVEQAWYE